MNAYSINLVKIMLVCIHKRDGGNRVIIILRWKDKGGGRKKIRSSERNEGRIILPLKRKGTPSQVSLIDIFQVICEFTYRQKI